MGLFTVKDGTQIFYKDWGSGRPLFFHHGWPLSADDWDAQAAGLLGEGNGKATASCQKTNRIAACSPKIADCGQSQRLPKITLEPGIFRHSAIFNLLSAISV